MNLHRLADSLLEIRRHVRSNPRHVEMAAEVLASVLCRDAYKAEERDWGFRLGYNLLAGIRQIVVNPEILEGYLYGAAAEIRELAHKQEGAR